MAPINPKRLQRLAVVAYLAVIVGLIAYLARRVWQRAEYSDVTRALVSSCTRHPLALDDASVYHHINTPCDRAVEREFIKDASVQTLEYQVDIAINSLGFRNDEYPVEKPPGHTRIVLLGDSFVYGHGVRHHETFYKRLERKLNADGDDRHEVWNIAAPSWGTLIHRRVVEGPLRRFSPDLVILFLDNSDMYDDEAYRRLQGSDGSFPATADMRAYWALRDRIDKAAWEDPKQDGGAQDAAAALPSYQQLRAQSIENIKAIASNVRAWNVPFLVVTYPYPTFTKGFERGVYGPTYEQLDRAGISRLSLFEHFPPETHSRYYFLGNRHWNAAGSQRVADVLFEVLPQRYPKLFPRLH